MALSSLAQAVLAGGAEAGPRLALARGEEAPGPCLESWLLLLRLLRAGPPRVLEL